MSFQEFIKSAASVKPSVRQMRWFETEFYAFVHFTVNTYTDLEWGNGNEDPSIFNPYDLDCDEWVESVKSAGKRSLPCNPDSKPSHFTGFITKEQEEILMFSQLFCIS